MNEAEYWSQLEFRVCSEIEGLKTKIFQGYCCDGFIPESFDMDHARINGRVWIGIGKHQELWDFSLSGNNVRSRESIDWARLLPGEDMTGWLVIDARHKSIKINLQSAFPDRQLSTE
jgi:hypothetical protein